MPTDAGRLEVICGCMYSGKTTELINRLEDARQNGFAVAAFKHAVDTRDSTEDLVTHTGTRFQATAVATPECLHRMITEADVVGVDEAQFFDGTLLATCAALTDAGKRIIVAGLDRTCFGDPFEPVPALAGAAGHVTRLQARCARCDQPAEFTQRLIDDKHPDDVHHNDPGLIGADDQYEPRCRTCFAPVHAAV